MYGEMLLLDHPLLILNNIVDIREMVVLWIPRRVKYRTCIIYQTRGPTTWGIE